MNKKLIPWIAAVVGLFAIMLALIIALAVEVSKRDSNTAPARTHGTEDETNDSNTNVSVETEEVEEEQQNMTGYTFNSTKEVKGVKVSFTNLFLEEDRAVAVVKVKNKTNHGISLYPEQDGMLSLDGKQAKPNMDDSDTTSEIMKDSEVTMYISFFMPEGVDWEEVKKVQFGTGVIYGANDYEHVGNISVKVDDIQNKVDESITLEENAY